MAFSYPDNWYRDITASSKYYSLAATIGPKIIGMIIAEVKPRSLCNKEVSWVQLYSL